MSNTLVCNESMTVTFAEIAGKGCFQYGLLIGQRSGEKDFLLHLACAPGVEKEHEQEITELEEKVKVLPENLSAVSEAHVADHVHQVRRMLPGGIDVIGVYVAIPQSDFSTPAAFGKLKSILSAVSRITSKYTFVHTDQNSEFAVLHICTQTSRVVVKYLNVSDVLSSPTSGELKYVKGGSNWHQINYTYKLELPLYLPSDKSSHLLCKSVMELLQPWFQRVRSAIILIDGKLMKKNDQLSPEPEVKVKKKRKGMPDMCPPKIYQAEFVEPGIGSSLPSDLPLGDCSGTVTFSGNVAGRVFVEEKFTVAEAQQALMTDLIRSVVSRWEMHCDSLVEESSFSPGVVLHEPPRRVFLEGGGLPVSLCDYLFPGDTVLDACQSAKELLGITVHEENVFDNAEVYSDTEDILDPHSPVVHDSHQEFFDSSRAKGTPSMFILAAGIVALLSILVSYVLLVAPKYT